MKLTDAIIHQKLSEFPNWNYQDNAIQAKFKFDNFKDCFSIMSRIAFECEVQNHHPDWTNVYNSLEIKLSTHDANGVTEKDFQLAEIINTIIDSYL